MQLLIVILKKEDMLETLIRELAENGVKGGTILEGSGMAEALYNMEDLPIFQAIRSVISDAVKEKSQVMLFALGDEQVKATTKMIKKVTGNLEAPNTGIMFTVPINYIEGFGC